MNTSNAGVSSTGRLSQTKYYLSDLPPKITIIRRHHPLEGEQLDVLTVGNATMVVPLCVNLSLDTHCLG